MTFLSLAPLLAALTLIAPSPDGVRAPGPVPVQPPAHTAYDWPTGGPVEVLARFSPPTVPWGAGHRGVDLAHPPGAPVLAAADGVVAFAGPVVERSVVSIQHADGIRTTYEPVLPVVATGDRVTRGQLIGHLAAGHCPTGCLHLGARRAEDRYLDPLSLFDDVVIRLLI